MIFPLLLALAQQQPIDGLDAYVAQAMKDWRVPGLAIVVVKDDSVTFIKGYGVRELGKPDPVTVHTRFGNMSTTKAFTALLVAMLADSGKLAFDDPVSKFRPEAQFSDPYVTREATVRDLLTHRIGFGDPDYLWDNSGLDFAQMVSKLRRVPPTSSFRSDFEYNNVSYGLAGDIAGRAGGSTWQALMQSRIYGPLGMTESYPDARSMQAAGVSDVSSPHGHRARHRAPAAGSGYGGGSRRARGRCVLDGDRHGEVAAVPARQWARGGKAACERTELRAAVSATASPGGPISRHRADAPALPGLRPRLVPARVSRRVRRLSHRLDRRPLGHRRPDAGPAPWRCDLHQPRSL